MCQGCNQKSTHAGLCIGKTSWPPARSRDSMCSQRHFPFRNQHCGCIGHHNRMIALMFSYLPKPLATSQVEEWVPITILLHISYIPLLKTYNSLPPLPPKRQFIKPRRCLDQSMCCLMALLRLVCQKQYRGKAGHQDWACAGRLEHIFQLQGPLICCFQASKQER